MGTVCGSDPHHLSRGCLGYLWKPRWDNIEKTLRLLEEIASDIFYWVYLNALYQILAIECNFINPECHNEKLDKNAHTTPNLKLLSENFWEVNNDRDNIKASLIEWQDIINSRRSSSHS